MSSHYLKLTFSFVGILTAYTILKVLIIPAGTPRDLIVTFAIAILTGVLFYILSDRSLKHLSNAIDTFEIAIHNMSVYEIFTVVIGIIAGLIVANLVSIPFIRIDIIGIPIAVGLNILFSILGFYVAASKRNEANSLLDPESKKNSNSKIKLLDTSSIIDGRLIDISNAGFLDGKIIIPSFVLEELHHLSDSADNNKRARGRRGLDVLDILQKDKKFRASVESMEGFGAIEVDDKLIRAAKKYNAKIITNDYNLNKVASIQGVEVLNINELAKAVKPLALPGEEMTIQVVKEGKEAGQGIGYMNDGTMIVVEGGKKFVNQTIDVVVTSILQTSAGRMIFSKAKI